MYCMLDPGTLECGREGPRCGVELPLHACSESFQALKSASHLNARFFQRHVGWVFNNTQRLRRICSRYSLGQIFRIRVLNMSTNIVATRLWDRGVW